VNSIKKESCKKSWGGSVRRRVLGTGRLVWLSLTVLACGFPTLARQNPTAGAESGLPDALATGASTAEQLPDPQLSGRISGRVVDPSGVAAIEATVRLTCADQSLDQQMLSDDDGRFSFSDVPPGSFRLTITLEGFATQTFAGNLRSGEGYLVPQIVLPIASASTEIRVVPSQTEEVAEAQIKDEEKQRALGFIPNFYVSYIPNAAPLTPKQKFELAGKTIVDPVTFGLTGVAAGLQQANNNFRGYGQGAQGYAKRYGAAYADTATSTLIGSAILPSLLKQDPRYFYKGTGSKRSRFLYAVANSVICKGDNGHWQANYSSILGSLAAGGISNLYYPANDRGARLTFENTLIAIGATAAANVLQEFVIRKLTPNVPNPDPAKP
jgi:hypothetical protein